MYNAVGRQWRTDTDRTDVEGYKKSNTAARSDGRFGDELAAAAAAATIARRRRRGQLAAV